MAITKPLYERDVPDGKMPTLLDDESFDFELPDGGPNSEGLATNPDGSVEVTLGSEEPPSPVAQFGDNLANFLKEDELTKCCSELVDSFEADKRSRKDWEDAYLKGLDLLGMSIEDRSEPWPGASGVYHPLLTEAVVRFQAQTMTEIFPAAGPVQTKIIGEETNETVSQAKRIKSELNYQLTERMTEWRYETEQMLFRLPLAGSAFKKVYLDPIKKRPCSMFVPAEDFVIAYGASGLEASERYTHVMKKTKNEVKKLQKMGFYKDIILADPVPDTSKLDEKMDKLGGQKPQIEVDDRYTLLEMHVDYALPGIDDEIAVPYVITVDKQNQKILSIYRNWEEMDGDKKKILHFVHYPYMPGLGFYGTGLIHLMGGLAKTSTSILRQLIDAGTLSNLPGGLKTRGLRIKGDDRPILPGEWRDVDIPGGVLKDSLFPLPYKEPSAVLLQLLQGVVDEGRRIGSIADLQVGEMSQQAPVGTTLALLERSLKVMSSVQARVHWALHQELRLISKIVAAMGPKYDFNVGGEFSRADDFNPNIVDVIPVSDPNASTMSQRVVKMQAALTLAAQAPNIYNLPALHRQAMEALDVAQIDLILPIQKELPPQDPVTENMSILVQKPVKAHYYQDHEAHIRVHMALAMDPQILELIGQSPAAVPIQSAMAAHITEHVAFAYRKKVEQALGVSLPDPSEPLPEDVEYQLSRVVADGAEKVLANSAAEKQKEEALQNAQDPLAHAELLDSKTKLISALVNAVTAVEKIDIEREKIQSQEEQTSAKLGVELVKTDVEAVQRAKEAQMAAEQFEELGDDQKIGQVSLGGGGAPNLNSGGKPGEQPGGVPVRDGAGVRPPGHAQVNKGTTGSGSRE
jgi:hypothetical protein